MNYGISQKYISIEGIKNKFPKVLLVTHIIGEHSRPCDMYDWYTHEYITGYGNERTALLFEHYKVIGSHWDDNHFLIIKDYLSIPEIGYIEFNIHSISKDDKDMLSKLGSMLQEYIGEPLVVSIDKDKTVKIDEFADYLYQKINRT